MRLTPFALLATGVALVQGQAAPAPTSEADQASRHGYDAQCAPYGAGFVSDAIAAKEFPDPQPTTPIGILPNDADGQAKFNSFQANIPKIAVKSANASYNSAADPDCYWTESLCVTPKLSGLKPDVAMAPEPRTLGYGFDDGPACDHNEFYDFLAKNNQTATMFYIGRFVLFFPYQAQRATTDGHHICVHTWTHPMMTYLTNEQAFAELWYTLKAIKFVTNVTPTCWRPPHGDVDDRIRFIAQSLNLQTIMWKYDAFDWALGQPVPQADGTSIVETADSIQGNYDNFIAFANNGTFNQNGAIFLTHEQNNFTMDLAMKNYPRLVQAFDHIVPVTVALNNTQPYVETGANVTFPSFNDYIAKHPKSSSSNSSSTSSNSSSSSTGGSSGGTSSTSATKGHSGGVAVLPSLGLAMAGLAGVRAFAFLT